MVYFYIPSLATGGAEKQCALVAGSLFKRGVDVNILVHDAGRNSEGNMMLANGAPIVELPKSPIARIRALVLLMRQAPGSIIFSYLARPNFYASLAGILAGDCHIYCGIRCGTLPWWKLVLEILNNRVLADGTIFNSYRAYNEFTTRGFKLSKSLVISNAFLPSHSFAKVTHEDINIVTVGRFTFEKDYYTWLTVIRRVLDAGFSIRGLIEGYGREERAIRIFVDEMKLSEKIDFYPGNYKVNELLARGDIYLSTSLSEGVSNSILEAMNAGLPVVATNVGDNNIMVEDGKSGYLARVGDVSALVESIIKLIKSNAQRRSFGARAKEILAEKYSLDGTLNKYMAVIKAGNIS